MDCEDGVALNMKQAARETIALMLEGELLVLCWKQDGRANQLPLLLLGINVHICMSMVWMRFPCSTMVWHFSASTAGAGYEAATPAF